MKLEAYRLLEFLTTHRTRTQVILKNTIWLAVAVGLATGVDFLLTVTVIRRFGALEYGKFAFGLSFAALFSTLFDFGLTTALVREFAGNRNKEDLVPGLLALKYLASLVGLVLVVALSYAISSDPQVRLIMFVLSLYVIGLELANFIYAIFRSRQRMEAEALCRALNAAFLVSTVLLSFLVRPSALSLSFAYLAAIGLTLAVVAVGLRQIFRISLRPSRDRRVWAGFVSLGLYIALTKAAGDATTYAGPVFLGAAGRLADISVYTAAAKVNAFVLFPMGLIAAAVFPALTEAFQQSRDRFARLWTVWAEWTILFAGLVVTVVYTGAPAMIGKLYGSRFAESTVVLRMLVLGAGAVYFQSVCYHALLILDRQRDIFLAILAGGGLSVVLNASLAAGYGPRGVAAAIVSAQVVILVEYIALTAKHAAVTSWAKGMLGIASITAISALIAYQLVSRTELIHNLPAVVAATGVVYALAVGAFLAIAGRVRGHPGKWIGA